MAKFIINFTNPFENPMEAIAICSAFQLTESKTLVRLRLMHALSEVCF